jgi:hypothetical protein
MYLQRVEKASLARPGFANQELIFLQVLAYLAPVRVNDLLWPMANNTMLFTQMLNATSRI